MKEALGLSDEGANDLPDVLSDLERRVLEVAQLRWKYRGALESHVRDEFGWSMTRFFQVLDHLLDRPAAVSEFPQLVYRLSRLRQFRRQARTTRHT